MAASSTLGVEVAVAYNGRIIANKAYGFSDEQGDVLNPSDLLPIGSATKSVTASMIRMLIEDGRLGRSTAVASLLPMHHQMRITVGDLLDQTSGLAEYNTGAGRELLLQLAPNANVLSQALIQYVDRGPALVPGAFHYSNSNYFLLGLIAERVTREPLAALYAATFRRLGVGGVRIAYRSDLPESPGYENDGFSLAAGPADPLDFAGAAGGLQATAAGVLRWDEAVAGMAVQTRSSQRTYRDGWFHDTGLLGREIYHDGLIGGFRAMNLLLPDRHLAIVAIGNTSSFDSWTMTHRLALAVSGGSISVGRLASPESFVKEWLTARRLGIATDNLQTSRFDRFLSEGEGERIRLAMRGLGAIVSAHLIATRRAGSQTVSNFDLRCVSGWIDIQLSRTVEGRISGVTAQVVPRIWGNRSVYVAGASDVAAQDTR